METPEDAEPQSARAADDQTSSLSSKPVPSLPEPYEVRYLMRARAPQRKQRWFALVIVVVLLVSGWVSGALLLREHFGGGPGYLTSIPSATVSFDAVTQSLVSPISRIHVATDGSGQVQA